MKRIYQALIAYGLTLLATAAVSAEGNLVVGTIRDAVTLDPAVAVATTDYIMMEAIYERLVSYERQVDDQGNVTASMDFAPALATDWFVSDDGLSWTFKLREGVSFHDGTEFTAEAVRYSFSRAITMGTGLSWQLSDALSVDDIEVVDDHTIVFHLKESYAPFLEMLRLPVASIVSPTAVESNGGIVAGQRNEWMINNAVGTGPFVLTSRANDQLTVMEANPQYWGHSPELSSLTFRIVPDPSTLRLLVSGQEVHVVALGLSWIDMLDLEFQPGITVYKQQSFPEIRMGPFNVQEPPFDNKMVRQAVSYAVDYETIIEGVMLGQAVRLTSAIPAGTFGHDSSIVPYQYDPEKARELLAEAGYPDGFTFEFAYPSADQERFEVATVIQANLAAVGINAELAGYAWPTLLEMWDNGDFSLSVGKWAPTGDPHARVYGLLNCDSFGNAGNYGRYCNPEIDRLMAEAVTTVDQDERLALYSEMQELLMDDAPWLFLYQPVRGFPLSDNVKGFHIPPAETFAWQYVSLD